jgi:glutathione S-transferase
MLTIHHAPQSRSSRILWLLEEVGATYTIALTNIPRPDGSGAPDPGNPHPDKKVPALVDAGTLVTESAAIVLYLTDKFPGAGIGPTVGDPLRGRYLSWLAYYAGVMEPVATLEFAGIADNPAVVRTFRGRAEMDARVRSALSAGPWVLGERFSGRRHPDHQHGTVQPLAATGRRRRRLVSRASKRAPGSRPGAREGRGVDVGASPNAALHPEPTGQRRTIHHRMNDRRRMYRRGGWARGRRPHRR